MKKTTKTLLIHQVVMDHSQDVTLFCQFGNRKAPISFLGISLRNLFVYLGFITVVLLGSKIKSIKFGNILLASIIFFLLSNFGVWILGYPKNFEGLLLCYTMAIPFFGYSIAGDLFFGYLFKFSFKKISSVIPESAN